MTKHKTKSREQELDDRRCYIRNREKEWEEYNLEKTELQERLKLDKKLLRRAELLVGFTIGFGTMGIITIFIITLIRILTLEYKRRESSSPLSPIINR